MESFQRCSLLLVLLLVSVHNLQVRGFSVKKRATEDDIRERDVNQLADAVKVIQRAKRAAFFAELRRPSWPSEEDGYFDEDDDNWEAAYPGRGYGAYEASNLGDLFGDEDESAAYSGPPYWPEMDPDQNADSRYDLSDNGEMEQDVGVDGRRGGGSSDDGDDMVSDDELAELFTEMEKDKSKRSDSEKESLSEALLGPAANSVNPTAQQTRADPEKVREEDDVKLSELSPEQLDNLIQSVENAENNALMEDRRETPGGNDDDEGSDVSAEELGDIFGEQEGENDNDDGDDDGHNDNNGDRHQDDGNDGADDDTENGRENEVNDSGSNTDEENDDNDGEDNADDENGSRQLNKEWLIAQYLDGFDGDGDDDVITTKRKRSEEGSFIARALEGDTGRWNGESPDDLATELAIAREDIKVLRTFLDKEDEENANLAYALNLATKSQTDRTDKYIDEEIAYIKKAIQNEMDIQEVKDVLNIAASLDDSPSDETDSPPAGFADEESVGGTDFLEPNKRADPELLPADEVDIPDGDEERVSDSDIAGDMTDGDLVKALLASKLEKLLTQVTSNDVDKMTSSSTGRGWYDRPVLPSVADAENEPDWYLNPLLRQLWQKYRDSSPESKRGYEADSYPVSENSDNLPIDLSTLQQVLTDSLEKENLQDEGTCPAVEQISTYCSFINDLGLELDEEALELCNKHEVCYTCGSDPYIDLSADDCDRNYLQEAARLCQNKQGCDVDASRLFILMLRYQTFSPAHAPRQCSEPCTREYVTGSRFEQW